MVLPSLSVTIAFFVSFLKPDVPLNVFILPRSIDVFIFKTFTLNSFSIACLISEELESFDTIKEY